MKKSLIIFLILINNISLSVAPYYSIRSQSVNAARNLVGAGWNTQINLCDTDTINGTFSITPEYTKSFRPYYISKCLFGDHCCSAYPSSSCPSACDPYKSDNLRTIRISGSQATSRCANDWLADYFGLPTDYVSYISFEPEIENFIVDFGINLGLDCWLKGLFFRVHAPVVHTRWDLNICECAADEGSNAHWPGYFSDTLVSTSIGITTTCLISSFESYVRGCATICDTNIAFNPLCFARMNRCRIAKTGVAELRMLFGWNFLCNDDYHTGLNIRIGAPTGNRPNAWYLFEPIVGNGHHWELGGGFSGHWTFWRNSDEEESCELYLDANVTHLFKARQCRTFDLCCKPLSRYMLAAKYASSVNDLKAGTQAATAQVPSAQFLEIYTPVANISTMPVNVSVSVQADIALMLQYITGNFSFDLGYNLWARSCENIELRHDYPCLFQENRWALKGDAFMYGFKPDLDGSMTSTAVPLSATQSNATLYCGTNNWPSGIGGIAYPQNPGIDNLQLAWDSSNNALLIYDVTNTTTRQIYTSLDPIFLKFCDIDLCSAGTKGLSHKIFAHVDHTWHNNEDWIPYIGIGGEVEFGHHSDVDCSSCCTTCTTVCNPCCTNNSSCCQYCAVSQWGIWLKGGVGFN